MDRDQLKQLLLQVLQQATRTSCSNLTEASNLQNGLGLDSLGLVGVVIDVQDRLDISLHLEEVRDIATVGEMLTLLQAKLALEAAKNAA